MSTCLVVSTALRTGSETLTLAKALCSSLKAVDIDPDLFDLGTTALPGCDGGSCYSHDAVKAATARVKQADGVVICSPVYNYHFNSAAKNFVELTNDGWPGKIVGLAANGGSERSFMAALPFLNLLWLDHRCLVVPRFVYATPPAFDQSGELIAGDCRDRIDALAKDMARLIARLTQGHLKVIP